MLQDIALITYTTSKYSDVWNMHFGQLSVHASNMKSYAFSDEDSKNIWDFPMHQLVTYVESDPYWKQYLGCLKSVSENYVIYSQEDFILFSGINYEAVLRYRNFLNNSNYDYVRLIRCGYSTPLNNHVTDDIHEVDMSTSDAFSMQATLWKKSSIQKLYHHVKSQKWLESDSWNSGARTCGIRGTFIYNGEPKIGAFHYDSKVWPYVCTAINRGKWNVDQYPEVMKHMFQKYNVDPSMRGIRVR
jgi:hypothetical protein